MNIIFTKLPTTDGIIKISLDGGQSFIDCNIADIPEDGLPLSDDQDFEKIRIKGPANLLKNLDIVSSVKVEVDSDVVLSEYVEKKYFQGELYDGGCGYGYRITSWPDGISGYSSMLYDLYLEDGMTLGRLCEYDGHFDAFYGYEPPTGQLYARIYYTEGCPGSYRYVPTRYFLKSTNNTSN
jgi:hypothetical protein